MSDEAFHQSSAGEAANAEAERRLLRRQKAFRPAIIMAGGSQRRLHLLDLTTEGALGYAYDPPASGSNCALLLLDQRVEAEVIWMDDRKFGLRFIRPLSPDLVEKLLIVG